MMRDRIDTDDYEVEVVRAKGGDYFFLDEFGEKSSRTTMEYVNGGYTSEFTLAIGIRNHSHSPSSNLKRELIRLSCRVGGLFKTIKEEFACLVENIFRGSTLYQ